MAVIMDCHSYFVLTQLYGNVIILTITLLRWFWQKDCIQKWVLGSGAGLLVCLRRQGCCWCCWILRTKLCFWAIVAWARLWEERRRPPGPPSSSLSGLLLLPPFFRRPLWRRLQLLRPPTPSDVLSPPLASLSSFRRGRAASPWSPAAPARRWKEE